MKRVKPDFAAVQAKLAAILRKYEKGQLKGTDTPGNYTLAGPSAAHGGKVLWFWSVCTQKHYVSYHLMPVYGCRELLDEISPALKRRMQGKACFNFTAVDHALFKELATLTDRGHKRFKQLEYIA